MKSYLNSVVDAVGEYRKGEIYMVYGSPSVGKTLYLIGEAINLIGQGATVIWIDTEGGFDGLWEKWRNIYVERFGIKWDDAKFIYKRIYTYKGFMEYMGLDVDIDRGKGEKISVIYKGDVKNKENSVFEAIGKKKNIVVMVDSISSIFRLEFQSNVQNFSGRADAMGLAIYGLWRVMEKTDGFVIASSHATSNPTNPYETKEYMRGGIVMEYYSKHILWVEVPKKKILEDYRRIHAVRTEKGKDWSIVKWAKVTDKGWVDASEEEVENVLNGGKSGE